MSHFTDIVEYIVDTMNPASRFSKTERDNAVKFLTVEIASLIQDSHNDYSIRNEAERIMAEEMAKDH